MGIGRVSKTPAPAGSHSHKICCVDLRTGEVVWTKRLGGRIESSACHVPSPHRHAAPPLVAVGCYDAKVYFLRLRDGQVSAPGSGLRLVGVFGHVAIATG